MLDQENLLDNVPQSTFAKLITTMPQYNAGQIQIELSTDHNEEALNHILKELLPDVQGNVDELVFEFLVEGKLLRGKVKSHLVRYGISCEGVLTIQYFLPFKQLDNSQEVPEEDWISSLAHVMGPDNNLGVVIGMFDGGVGFYDKPSVQKTPYRCKVHEDPIKSIKCAASNKQYVYYIISGGLGEELKLNSLNSKWEMQVLSINQHEGSILGLDCNPLAESYFCSVGSSGCLCIWHIPEDFQTEPYNEIKVQHKKRQVPHKVVPMLGKQQIHDDSINSVCWVNNEQVITGSSDHSMKVIDVGSLKQVRTIKTKDSITTCINFKNERILSTHEDGYVRMWDIRDPINPTSTFKSHARYSSCCQWSSAPNVFASGSYDQTIKIWDTRSVFPLQTIPTSYDKVLCLGWDSTQRLISGGSNPLLTYHSVG